jgi:hypothetical protein
VKPMAKKQAIIFLLVVIYLGTIVFDDWRYFFPFPVHSDFRFQIIGESIEILALIGIVVSMYFAFAKTRSEIESAQESYLPEVRAGAIFAMMLIVLHWRDFFPHNSLEFSAGFDRLTSSLVGGALFVIFGFAFGNMPRKRVDEDKKTIV